MVFSSSKEDLTFHCAVVDVLTCQVVSICAIKAPELPLRTEFIEKQNDVIVSHTLSIYAKDLTSLILKVCHYVCDPQNATE